MEEKKEESLVKVITDYATDKQIDFDVLQDEIYMEIQGRLERRLAEVSALELPREQSLAIDDLLSLYNESAAYYGKVCYRRGLMDCVALLRELKVIG